MPKRWRQALWSILPLLACAFPAPAQSPLVDAKELRSLPRIARDLAAQGHAAEWRDLVAALAALGLPAKELDALRRDGEKVLAIRKKPAAKTAALAKALRDECARLDRRLVGRNDAAAREVARHLLVLDADCAHANGVLGREFVEGRWTVAGAAARSARRAELLAALQRARTLEVPIEIDEGDGNTADGKASGAFLLAEVLGRQVVRARCGQVVVHSMKSAAQTERMLRQTIRALAFAAFAAGKPFALPAAGAAQIVWIDSRPIYVQVAAAALQRGLISAPMHAEALQLDGFYLSNGALVDFGRLESEFETALLIALDGDRFGTEMVVAGFCNWVCMNFLGTAIPRYAWTETTERRLARAQRTTTETEAERVLREEMLRLADAGIAGSRSYLRYLAERRLDPPWIDAMEDRLGKIRGEELLKTTFVVEYLLEEQRLVPLDAALDRATGTPAERLAAALGQPLATFEQTWRDWLTGAPPGIVQRLTTEPATVPPAARATLAALAELRTRAFTAQSASVGATAPVTYDAALAEGCIAHAAYLGRHPEHAAAWPAAHEENPEHPDWTAAGAWAAAHAVIAPGARSGEEALRQWMGTFYHRLPLIDPGLVRIGFGLVGDCAVLDAGSMVAFQRTSWLVAWPPAGAEGVPTAFVPELPNPVPGEDQQRFGYPITLQLGVSEKNQNLDVEMRLFRGGQDDRELPCWFSSPEQPTNPELAPANCYCLIPKGHLQRGTIHTVVVNLRHDGKTVVWSFRT